MLRERASSWFRFQGKFRSARISSGISSGSCKFFRMKLAIFWLFWLLSRTKRTHFPIFTRQHKCSCWSHFCTFISADPCVHTTYVSDRTLNIIRTVVFFLFVFYYLRSSSKYVGIHCAPLTETFINVLERKETPIWLNYNFHLLSQSFVYLLAFRILRIRCRNGKIYQYS